MVSKLKCLYKNVLPNRLVSIRPCSLTSFKVKDPTAMVLYAFITALLTLHATLVRDIIIRERMPN